MLIARTVLNYHRTKAPRVPSQKELDYKRDYAEAMARAKQLSAENMKKSMEEYLAKHQAKLDQQNRHATRAFNSFIARSSKGLQQQLAALGEKDALRRAREADFAEQEQVRRFNRERILRVLKEESKFWVTEDNVSSLRPETVLPPEALSSEYFHKVQAEGLAYEAMDFEELERLASEDGLAYRNSKLIPLFLSFRESLRALKALHPANLEKYYSQLLEASPAEDRARIEAEFRGRAERLRQGGFELMDEQARLMLDMLVCWANYVEVLRMTNSEIRFMGKMEQQGVELKTIEERAVERLGAEAFENKLASGIEKFTEDEEGNIDLRKLLTEEDTNDEARLRAEREREVKDRKMNTVLAELEKLVPEPGAVERPDLAAFQAKSEAERARLEALYPSNVRHLLKLRDRRRIRFGANDIPTSAHQVWNSSVVAEAWKRKVVEENGPAALVELLTRLGEVKVQEPELLMRMWQAY